MFKPFLTLFMGTNCPLMHRLTPGLCKTYRCRNLELPFMQEGDCWGCMDCVNHCGCYCAQVSSVTMCSWSTALICSSIKHHPSTPWDHRGLDGFLSFIAFHDACDFSISLLYYFASKTYENAYMPTWPTAILRTSGARSTYRQRWRLRVMNMNASPWQDYSCIC